MPPPPPHQTLHATLTYANGYARRFVVTDPSPALLEALRKLVEQHGGRAASTTTFIKTNEESK